MSQDLVFARRLASSSTHTVVVTDKGQAYGWGSTQFNQLGPALLRVSKYISHPTPLVLPSALEQDSEDSPATTIVDAACGRNSTVLLLSTGQILQWEAAGSLLWAPETRILVERVSSGASHSLLVDSSRNLHAWGDNTYGQLGLGDFQARLTPTLVPDLFSMQIIDMAAGERHSLCTSRCGDCFAFGYNEQGQLGLGHTRGEPAPVLVSALEAWQIVSVACGAWHSGALSADGKLVLFGSGSFGKLGNGTEADVLLPVRENDVLMETQSRVLSVSLGETQSACVLEDGRLFVWGQLGGAETLLVPRECRMIGGLRFTAVCCTVAGASILCTERKTGNLYAWTPPPTTTSASLSAEVQAELLLPRAITLESAPLRTLPALVNRFTVQQIATGSAHVLLLTNNGLVYSFGANEEGQCGMIKANPLSPSFVNMEPHRISFIACGWNHSLVVTLQGDMLEFGRNKFEPTRVAFARDDRAAAPATRVAQVATGENHSACITRAGELFTWGQSSMGKLGLGALDRSYVPWPTRVLFSNMDLFLPQRISAVSCGKDHTLALSARDGELYGFGLLAGREMAETPKRLLAQECIVQASAGEMHSICINELGEVFRSSTRDNFVKLEQTSVLSAAAGADGRTLLLCREGEIFALERNETVGRREIMRMADCQQLAMNGALARDGAVYHWNSRDFKPRHIPALSSPTAISSNNNCALDASHAMETREALEQVEAFKAAFASYPESAKVPVLAIQHLLRAAARRRSEFSDQALKTLVLETKTWDQRNLDQLVALKLRERQVLAPLEISCQFAAQHVSRLVAKQDREEENATAVLRSPVNTHLLAAIPILETILGLFLVNPGYMLELYSRQASNNSSAERDLFVGLCRDLYSAPDDAHCERLFAKLVLEIAQREICDAQDTFDEFASKQQHGYFFPALLDLLPIKHHALHARIQSILRKELLILRSSSSSNSGSAGEEMANACKLFVDVFAHKIMAEVVLQHFAGAAQIFFHLRTLLLRAFGTGKEEEITLWICACLCQRLFLPVLFEQCTREEWPELYYAMEKMLKFALKPVPSSSASFGNGSSSNKRTSNFEQTLARYHGLVRGSLPLRERIELDQALIEATSNAKKRDFVLKFEDIASRFRLLHVGQSTTTAAASAAAAAVTSAVDTEASIKVRNAALDLIRKDLAMLDQHALDVELVFDLIGEEMRAQQQQIVIFPTRRTLEYVQTLITRLAGEEISSQCAEWKFLLRSCRQAARELKGRWQEPALDLFDDVYGTALRLDLSNGSAAAAEAGQEGWTSRFRLDSVTQSPIPLHFTAEMEDDGERADVLGLRLLEQVLDSSQELQEFRARFMSMSTNSANAMDEDFTRSSYELIKEMEDRDALFHTSTSVLLLQEALSLEIASANRILDEQIEQYSAYSNVLRYGDPTKLHLEEVARRKLGREYQLTDFHFIRTIQLGGAPSSSSNKPRQQHRWRFFGLLSSTCQTLPQVAVATTTSDASTALVTWKQHLADHGLVRGAFATYTYQELADKQVVRVKETNPFDLGKHQCQDSSSATVQEEATSAFQDLFMEEVTGPHCPFEDARLLAAWNAALSKRLRFHFHLSAQAKFTIKLTYDVSTVISQVEIDMFKVVNFSKTCTLDWTPQTFPVSFRVRKLLFLVQEMVIKSFM